MRLRVGERGFVLYDIDRGGMRGLTMAFVVALERRS